MRRIAGVILISAVLTGPLTAQEDHGPTSALADPSGPLQEAPPATVLKKPKPHAAQKHAAQQKPGARPAADQAAEPVDVQKTAVPENPVSVGMKWNGNNDSATQTRTQNYGGNAVGAGAAVGLNLHF